MIVIMLSLYRAVRRELDLHHWHYPMSQGRNIFFTVHFETEQRRQSCKCVELVLLAFNPCEL